MRPMITNGGPHPHDKWADMTTETILELVKIKEDSDTPEATEARSAKRMLRTVLFDIFEGHHGSVQKSERKSVPKDPHAHVAKPIDVEPHLSVMDEVFAALDATPFKSHFAKPDVRAILTAIVGTHTADVIHIERRYHQDRHVAAKGA